MCLSKIREYWCIVWFCCCQKEMHGKALKGFFAVSHLAFKSCTCKLAGIAFLSAISSRSYVFSASRRCLVYSMNCYIYYNWNWVIIKITLGLYSWSYDYVAGICGYFALRQCWICNAPRAQIFQISCPPKAFLCWTYLHSQHSIAFALKLLLNSLLNFWRQKEGGFRQVTIR